MPNEYAANIIRMSIIVNVVIPISMGVAWEISALGDQISRDFLSLLSIVIVLALVSVPAYYFYIADWLGIFGWIFGTMGGKMIFNPDLAISGFVLIGIGSVFIWTGTKYRQHKKEQNRYRVGGNSGRVGR